jgi:cysteine desulfurase / selenocysteine lyase
MTAIDSFVGNAEAFPILSHWHFFNHAGVAPCPQAGADAMKHFCDELRNGVYLGTRWYADIEILRRSAARLMNAEASEVCFVKNTSEGICTVAKGIDWQFGDRIVTTNIEYPANIYPWMEVSRRHGAELVMVEEITNADGRREVPLQAILQEIEKPRTRLVALSHVEFASGQRHDIAAIGRACRERGVLFCVDAIQSLGVLPVDVKAMCIDYLAADGHKWLLGPEGAGVFYVRQDLQDRTRPLAVGWMNVINADDYGDYDYTLKADARRYECGSYNIVGLLGLKASLELLAGIGTDALAARLKTLTDRLIAGLQRKGYDIVSPRGQGQWSGIVSFTSKTHPHQPIVPSLRKDHRTEIALREDRLRASPHFYNTETQIDRLIDLLPGH